MEHLIIYNPSYGKICRLLFVIVSACALTMVTADVSCSDGGNGLCVSPGAGIHICPDNYACIVATNTCCLLTSIVQATSAPVVAACVDLKNPSTGVSDCPRMASYCNDPNYYSLMTTQCPKTCNRCPTSTGTGTGGTGTGGTGTSSCVDLTNPSTGMSDCAKDAYLCNNPAYVTLMRQQCPKTCGFC